jgi:nucleoside-diphosphate-sugar epimerase
MSKHLFLTGGTGFLGANVLKRALREQWSVTMLVRSHSQYDQTDAVMEGGDWRESVTCVTAPEPAKFCDWFLELGIDAVIHTAAKGGYSFNPSELQSIVDSNITLGAQLLESLHQMRLGGGLNKPMVFCGSYWQHSAPDGDYQSNSFYAATKTAFEDLAAFYHSVLGHPIMGVKFYDTYGVNDLRNRVVDLIIDALESQTPVRFSAGEQQMLPLAIDDGVEAIIRALDILEGGDRIELTYGAAGPERVTVRQLAALIEELSGLEANIEWGAFDYREFEVRKPFALAPVPGWTPDTPLATGVKSLLKSRGVI